MLNVALVIVGTKVVTVSPVAGFIIAGTAPTLIFEFALQHTFIISSKEIVPKYPALNVIALTEPGINVPSS